MTPEEKHIAIAEILLARADVLSDARGMDPEVARNAGDAAHRANFARNLCAVASTHIHLAHYIRAQEEAVERRAAIDRAFRESEPE